MNSKICLIVLTLCLLFPGIVNARIFARWHTSMGSFTAELYDELVPITAYNFRDLANDGFYNGLIFHRVIDGFMIQDGCPYGTGYGGPGYTIQDEFHPDLAHDHAGVLAMARTSAPNSAGSQYYITVAPALHLDGAYAIFGDIIEGLENVLAIGAVPTDANDRPLEPVSIYSVRMLDLQIGEFYPPLEETLELPVGQSQIFVSEAYTQEAQLSFEWYIDDVLQSENSFMLETSFSQGGMHTVRCNIASSDSISFEALWQIDTGSSIDDMLANQIPEAILYAHPNPFARDLAIHCDLKESLKIELEVYNLKGQKIRSLVHDTLPKGNHDYLWDGRNDAGLPVSSGIYLLRLKTGSGTVYRKITRL